MARWFAALIRDLSILLVEDHVQAREVTQLLLEGLGARVVAAVDGRDALDRLPEAHPDLVLTDLAMPRLGGRELLDRLRADPAHRSLPVVAVSGWPGVVRAGARPPSTRTSTSRSTWKSLAAVLCRVICAHRGTFARQRLRLRDSAVQQRRHCQGLRRTSAMALKQAAETRARGRALFAPAA